MDNPLVSDNGKILQALMAKAGIENLTQLSQVSGLSAWDISRVEVGLLPKMPVATLLKLAQALNTTPDDLLNALLPCSLFSEDFILPASKTEEVVALRGEYERLEGKFKNLEAELLEQWQNASLDVLESWLAYWPNAIASIEKNPELPAKKIIPLVKPVQELVTKWGLQPIGVVGEQIAYNPQLHQLIEGTATEGQLVKVKNVGYLKGDKLHLRAKVLGGAISPP